MIDFKFNYVVYQPYPLQDKVYYWLDGDKNKRIISRDDFRKSIDLLKVEFTRGNLYSTLNTYSFYFLSVLDKTIEKLDANTQGEPYPDHLMVVIKGKEPAQSRVLKEEQTIEQALNSYGFSSPSDESMQNLKVSLLKGKQGDGSDSFFSNIWNKLRGR